MTTDLADLANCVPEAARRVDANLPNGEFLAELLRQTFLVAEERASVSPFPERSTSEFLRVFGTKPAADEKPLPCPFPGCDGPAWVTRISADPAFFVECDGCDSLGPERPTHEEAARAWLAACSGQEGTAPPTRWLRPDEVTKPGRYVWTSASRDSWAHGQFSVADVSDARGWMSDTRFLGPLEPPEERWRAEDPGFERVFGEPPEFVCEPTAVVVPVQTDAVASFETPCCGERVDLRREIEFPAARVVQFLGVPCPAEGCGKTYTVEVRRG